jgi:hypothetical protein
MEQYELDSLPSWIRGSEFVKQFEIDFLGQPIELRPERNFPFPTEINEENIELVLENVRFFGVGDVAILRKLFRFLIDESDDEFMKQLASTFGELKMLWDNVFYALRYPLFNGHFSSSDAVIKDLQLYLQYGNENGYPWNETTSSFAAYYGQLDCLKFLHENGCPWNELTCSSAVLKHRLDCLKYAHENRCPWDKYTSAFAAEYGHLDCLKFLHENGCPWNEFTCSSAASEGQLDCLKYAHENGCPWDEFTRVRAHKKGHVDCLQYAQTHGCPAPSNSLPPLDLDLDMPPPLMDMEW